MSTKIRAGRAMGLLLGAVFATAGFPQPSDSNREMAARASSALMRALSEDRPTQADVSALLLNDRFEELEKLIKDSEERFARDSVYEGRLVGLYDVIASCDPRSAAKLDQWAKERPTYMSLTARGVYEVCFGERMRGEKFANETPAENFEQMEAAFAKAEPDLDRAVTLNSKFVPAYVALLEIAQRSGPKGRARTIEQRATAAIPGTYYVRQMYLMTLQPRWGGSYEEMQAYEDSLVSAAQKNPRIWSLRGESWADRGKSAWESHKETDAIKYYSKALEFGDRLSFLKARGSLYMNARLYGLALKDRERYQEYNSRDDEVNQDTVCLRNVGTIQRCWGTLGDN